MQQLKHFVLRIIPDSAPSLPLKTCFTVRLSSGSLWKLPEPAFLGSDLGRERISDLVWHNEDHPELRMEAVFILTELGSNAFTREQLNRVARDPHFQGQELRQAAVWGLGKAGLKSYDDLLTFIDDGDENVAMHAVAAFGVDTPQAVIDRLVQNLIDGDPRRAPASSEALRIIGTEGVLHKIRAVAEGRQPVPEWLLATLGRLPPELVRHHLQGSPLLGLVSPLLLIAPGANWLTTEIATTDIAFLLKQNLA